MIMMIMGVVMHDLFLLLLHFYIYISSVPLGTIGNAEGATMIVIMTVLILSIIILTIIVAPSAAPTLPHKR